MRVAKVEPGKITNEMVADVHARFVRNLKKLFDEHKKECGYPDAELEVF